MTALFYHLFIMPLSLVPTPILYRISDLLCFLVFYVLGYRKKVVIENLQRSFPERSHEEILALALGFYQHFCDIVVESFRSFSISNDELLRRLIIENPEVLDRHFAEGKDVVIGGGHYGNWEWLAVAFDQQVSHHGMGIYKPLSNRYLDEKMRKTRTRFGLEMVPIRSVPGEFSKQGIRPRAFLFGIDQSPGNASKAHWMRFLGQETAVQFGIEKYAREYNLPVLYGVIRKPKRGHYSVHFEDVTDRPRDLPHGEIVERITRMLESEIRREPRHWLWSHRRWKHRRPKDAKSVAPELLEANP